jgi:hypothetical protein
MSQNKIKISDVADIKKNKRIKQVWFKGINKARIPTTWSATLILARTKKWTFIKHIKKAQKRSFIA